MKKLSLLTFTFLSFFTHAQDQSMLMSGSAGSTTGLVNIRPYEPSKNIEGTQYYVDTFMPATVSTHKGTYMMRYNAAKDDMEFKKSEKQIFILNKSDDNYVINFTVGNEKYMLLDYVDKKNEPVIGYLKELFSSNSFSLYKREKINYIKPKYPKNGYDDYKPAKFKKVDNEFYFQTSDEKITYFPKNKKKLIAIFPENKKQIENFLKEKNPSFKSEEGMIKISQFISTL